jgi:hypothetical protein
VLSRIVTPAMYLLVARGDENRKPRDEAQGTSYA